MPGTIFLEAFGRLSPATNVDGIIDDEEEDLYSVFRARSELMSWYGADRSTGRPLAWHMHEAELTAGINGSRIGWAQVGLEFDGVELVLRLPALIQCFDDALRRFGVVDLSAIQVTADGLGRHPESCLGDLVSPLNWFNTALKARANALIAFDLKMLGDHTEAELFSILQRWTDKPFDFGPMVTVPEEHLTRIATEAPYRCASSTSDLGLPVTLPEWTASAAAWALAIVIDRVRTATPNVRNLAIRITRVQ
jgi:hypothetical protein